MIEEMVQWVLNSKLMVAFPFPNKEKAVAVSLLQKYGWKKITMKSPNHPVLKNIVDNPRYSNIEFFYNSSCKRQIAVIAEIEKNKEECQLIIVSKFHSAQGEGNR